MYKIIQITETNQRFELASELCWNDALVMAVRLCATDRECRYEIRDANDAIVFESYNKSDRGTRGFILHKKPRPPTTAVN